MLYEVITANVILHAPFLMRLGWRAVVALVEMSQKFDRLQVFLAAIPVRYPLPILAGISYNFV